ncbi:MAG: 4'-phosphopantetheinyl transferase superfamily protein [Bacteroidia bacterium]
MKNLIFKTTNSNDTIAVCSFDETIENEFSKLKKTISPEELNDIRNFKNENFRRQKMAGRVLLNNILGEEGKIEYNQHGKPLLKSHPFDISFSHAKDKVAVMLSKKTAGIDIQDITPRIRKIVHKYMNQPELNSLKEETYDTQATLYWCAKEALYKAYGERQLIFTDNIIIEPFSFVPGSGNFKGSIVLENSRKDFTLKYEIIGIFALVYLWNE